MNKSITVRAIKEGELNELIALYTHLHTDDLPLPSRSELGKLWHDIFVNPLLHYFVVEYDGSIVSSCTLSIIPNLTRGARPYGVIENVVTHPDLRNKGFAKAALKYALDFAWRSNYYKVMLLSSVYRNGAQGLYESVGFNKDAKVGYVAKPEDSL
jgi:GNAT superfamily N-acetyltransferase